MYDEVKRSPGSLLDPNVQQYSDILKRQYNHQHTVEADWPTRYGDDFFGRLILLEIKDNYITANTLKHKAFHLLRGKVDKISDFDKSKAIATEDVLKPNNNHHPLRVVVDGPPGIGKTTLCRKILKMWANGEITHEIYDLVLYCPLRNETVAGASTLTDLFTIECQKITSVIDWINQRHGKGLLIIFDGWDELSEQDRQTSLAAKIIRREKIFDCSVIVTSRTYASASLLKVPSIDRHVEVVGFSEFEVMQVIRGTLREDPDQAKKLIEHLQICGDALSLCYIPLICSIVISVCRTKDQFPVTLTELYHDFILQTIRRHVEINKNLGIRPEQINNLKFKDLPSVGKPMNQLCKLAYDGLKEKSPRMTFTTSQLESGLKDAVKRKYLGLMTTFTVFDKESHQFLHLTIQEFLAAMWIANNNIGEEVFKNYYGNHHFRMCLRFVAGLTHLENIYDQVIESMQNQGPVETVNDQSRSACSVSNSDQNSQTTQEQGLELNIHEHHFESIEDPFHEWPGDFSESDEKSGHLEAGYSCLRVPAAVSEYEAYCYSKFHQNTEILSDHWNKPNEFSSILFAFQVLYEAQNISYCQQLAEDIGFNKIPSLCLCGQNVSTFDMLCVSYFLQNSNMKWNHLHFADSELLKIFADSLLKHSQHNSTCNILDIEISSFYNIPSKFLCSSFLRNITECYCDYLYCIDTSTLLLMELLNLSKLKVLHFKSYFNNCHTSMDNKIFLEQCSKMKQSLQKNCEIQEIKLRMNIYMNFLEKKKIPMFIKSFIDGITTNRSIKSFDVDLHMKIDFEIDMSMVILGVLKNNHTLRALKVSVPEKYWISESIPGTIKVNTPLTAVYISENSQLRKLIIRNCKTLLYVGPNPPCLPSDLFLSQPFLQQLDLSLSTVEQAIELFTILKCNSTLTALQANIKNEVILADSGVGGSLKEMLEENKKMQHLEILLSAYYYQSAKFPEAYLPLMTAGLKHNFTLRGLRVPIPLSHASEQTVASFVEVISYKYNICELHMDIFYHQCNSQNDDEENKLKSSSAEQPSNEELTELYFSLQLPFVIKILKKNAKMKMLKIMFNQFHSDPLEKEEMPLIGLEFIVLLLCHPLLQYIRTPKLLAVKKFNESLLEQIYGKFMRTRIRNPPPLIDIG